MSSRTVPPFRADHVGSLLRPEPLLQARRRYQAGAIEREALREAEDTAILEAIELQRETGMRSVTDGEFRRTSWHMDFIYSLQGIERVDGESIHVSFKNDDREYDYAPPAMRVGGRVGVDDTIFGEAFAFVRDHAHGDQLPKLTIPSPSMVHYRGGDVAIDRDVYPDLDVFWSDLADAYAAEYSRLYDLGCRYLQLDDTALAYVNDPAQRAHIVEIGGDPDHLHERYIEVMNRSLAGRPDDLVVTVHLCRGNNQSMWAAQGGYDFVARSLFGDLDVDGYFLEYDDERSGGFEPLAHLPAGKLVVLGLVTSKRPELESRDMLKRRIDEAARYADGDQLCLSAQCGFASTEEGNDLTIDQERAKLELIVQVAEDVWG